MLLFVLGAIAGLDRIPAASRRARRPTPDKAIQEAKLTKEALEHPELETATVATEEVKE